MVSEGGQDRIVLICTSCKQNRLKMQEEDFSSCHSKVSQAGWLRKEIYSPALWQVRSPKSKCGHGHAPSEASRRGSFLVSSSPWWPQCCLDISVSAPIIVRERRLLPVCPCVFLLFSYKNTSHIGMRTTLVGPHLN